MDYQASKLLEGDLEVLREHTFTRWLSRDLAQAAVDFNRNIGLTPIYCKHPARYMVFSRGKG